MKYFYHVAETKVMDERGVLHARYGLAATASMPDMFAERERAEQLARLCNELELSIIHFPDVVEDAIIKEYT